VSRDVIHIGRVPIDRVTFSGALDAVERLVTGRDGGTVFTPNVDHVVLAERDEAFRRAYAAASLSLVDGVPVLWAARVLGQPLPCKISGSDFVPALLQRASRRQWSVYLLGGAAESAARASAMLQAQGVNVVGFASPYVDLNDTSACASVVSTIARTSPDLVLVGLGAPKQELFAHGAAARLAPAVLLGVGATIDFLAGTVPRAPAWVSRWGFEWLYRLAREPRRLWRRYLLRDPQFAVVCLRQLRAQT
jgi:N-acetylglucosaminyldiphosphoundecaprenol N-acetyl-beta-D-mannosaminyltransferase